MRSELRKLKRTGELPAHGWTGAGVIKLSRPLPSSQHPGSTVTPGGKKVQCPCFPSTSFFHHIIPLLKGLHVLKWRTKGLEKAGSGQQQLTPLTQSPNMPP